MDIFSEGVIPAEDTLTTWITSVIDAELAASESDALDSGFGSEFESKMVLDERRDGIQVRGGGRVRREYVHRFATGCEPDERKALAISKF